MTEKKEYPLLIKSPGDVKACLARIMEGGPLGEYPSVAELSAMADFMRVALIEDGRSPQTMRWDKFYKRHGRGTIELLGQNFKPDDFAVLLNDKHRRYGTESLLRWGHIGVLSRIDQKWARCRNMTNGAISSADCGDETVLDTLTDIVGYCVVGLLIDDYHNKCLTYTKE